MKQKRYIVFLIPLFLLCACGNDTTTTTKKVNSLKVEEDKSYLYEKDVFEIPFVKEQEAYINDDMKKIYSYVINIDSEDAKKASDAIQKDAMNQIANIKKLDDGLVQTCESLKAKVIESSTYVTILVEKQPFVANSEHQSKRLSTYIFDKKTGKECSTQDLLKQLNLTNEKLMEKVTETFKKDNKTVCGSMPGDCYYEPKIYKDDPYIPDTIVYVDQDDNVVVYVQKSFGLTYNWEPITLRFE